MIQPDQRTVKEEVWSLQMHSAKLATFVMKAHWQNMSISARKDLIALWIQKITFCAKLINIKEHVVKKLVLIALLAMSVVVQD